MVVREKKNYTPFPPAPVPSKIDLQIESGEYFLKEDVKKKKEKDEKKSKAVEKSEEKKRKRELEFVPPPESKGNKGIKPSMGELAVADNDNGPRTKKSKKSKKSRD